MKREGKAMNSRINDNMEIEYKCANCKKIFSYPGHGISYSKEVFGTRNRMVHHLL